MKGGLAVMLELATAVAEPAVDVTYVFYAGEEVAREHNGLLAIAAVAPELLDGDAAILGEPTGARSKRAVRACSSWRWRSAEPGPTRRGPGWAPTPSTGWRRSSTASSAYQARQPVIDGCQYREALQAVAVSGGVAGNVVPDRATVTLNHRFAPDRDADERRGRPARLARAAPRPDLGDRLERRRSPTGGRPVARPSRYWRPCCWPPVRRPGQTGLDRRGVLRRAWHPRRQLRARRPRAGPHRRRAGGTGADLERGLSPSCADCCRTPA